jgi:hypothetical protein
MEERCVSIYSKSDFFMLRNIRLVILVFILSFTLNKGFTQPCDGPDCGGDVDEVPLTGIEWLIGAGVLWGVRNRLKKKPN